ncbi:SPRY domain-containing protein [Paenibacillus elgii]|uniref:SPRY domain-containing protein n=1 Tax=Paenibacillus elgii TaxID=189691 RepID=UPI002041BEED|nr:SPRY domain-containing protein [Paenibacillus elgii]MCM3273914.1 hypothetical protein [Paenibacillus elgii]
MALVTWDDASKGSGVILSNGDLTVYLPSSKGVRANVGKTTGKWYWEITIAAKNGDAIGIGITNKTGVLDTLDANSSNYRFYYAWTGNKYPGNVTYGQAYSAVGVVISILLDLNNGKLEFWKNGVSQGVSHADILSMGEAFPFIGTYSSTWYTLEANFGDSAFVYTPPNGYVPYNRTIKYLFKDNNEIKTYPTPYTEDLCVGGTPFAVNTNGTTIAPVQNAFDNDPATYWGYGSGLAYMAGVAFIGYDFGDTNKRHIRKIVMYTADATNNVPFVIIQSSDDKITWTSLKMQNVFPNSKNIIELPSSNPRRYWRIVCHSIDGMGWNTYGYLWIIKEIEMVEAVSQSWITVGSSPITKEMLLSHGMGSLSHINRQSKNITTNMNDDGRLGQGKTFSYELDLNKLIDIKIMNIN